MNNNQDQNQSGEVVLATIGFVILAACILAIFYFFHQWRMADAAAHANGYYQSIGDDD